MNRTGVTRPDDEDSHASACPPGRGRARFPKPGILFRDITPLLRSHFCEAIAAIDGLWSEREWSEAEAVAGVESRGFILAAALAEKRGKGFVPIRKKGKLPPPVVERRYSLEYGDGILEMQRGRAGSSSWTTCSRPAARSAPLPSLRPTPAFESCTRAS